MFSTWRTEVIELYEQSRPVVSWAREAAARSGRDFILIDSSPEAEGWGLAAWLLPIAALLGGGAIVILVLRRMTGGRDAASLEPAAAAIAQTAAIDSDDADLERIVDEELRAGGA